MGQSPGDQAQRLSSAVGRADSLLLPSWCVAASPGRCPQGHSACQCFPCRLVPEAWLTPVWLTCVFSPSEVKLILCSPR